MPYTTVVTGTVITATWGNQVRDQVVTPFVSATARDSAITAPVEGMLAYLADSDTYTFYTGSTWLTFGHRIVDTIVLDQTKAAPFASGNFSSETEVTQLKLTIPAAKSGRLYIIEGSMITGATVASGEWKLRGKLDSSSGTGIGTSWIRHESSGNGQPHNFRYEWACAADATNKEIHFTLIRNSGSGSIDLYHKFDGIPCCWAAVTEAGPSSLLRTVTW